MSFKFLLPLAVIAAATPGDARLGAQSPDQPLKGISKITVDVWLSAEDTPPALTDDRLRTVTELKLRMAGLRVLSSAEDRQDPDINPSVVVSITMIRARSRGGTDLGYAFSTRLSVREYRVSPRNGAVVPSELWFRSYLNLASNEFAAAEVQRVLNDSVDALLNEWLRANPRP